METLVFAAEIWLSESVGSWAFVTLPADVGEEVRLRSGPPTAFGSVRVEVGVGPSTWRTSVFPDKARGYVLPVKAAVRRAHGLEVGDDVEVSLRVLGG
ncbi:DUF1905 domain-containing protein [Nocardioides sp. MAHUQ-72]|uniref:DUF1905 domain-containing protein n=1 Tax=unclassified Nocardioides TaxID=2615069 RepID=UPI0036107C41